MKLFALKQGQQSILWTEGARKQLETFGGVGDKCNQRTFHTWQCQGEDVQWQHIQSLNRYKSIMNAMYSIANFV